MKNKTIKLDKIQTNNKVCNRNLHRDHLLEVTDANGDIAYGSDLKAVADALNCTIGAVSNAARGRIPTVKGCKIKWVDSITLKEVAL